MKNFAKSLICASVMLSVAAVALSASFPGGLGAKKRGPDAPPTTITSDRLEFDYNSWVALFDGNVVVTDPEFTLKTDKMLLFLENTNDVKRVDCIGNVDMRSDDIRALCGRATYTRENARVLLTEEPIVSKGEQKISGEQISIWLNDERVEVENGVGVEARPDSFKTIKK